MLDLLTAYEAYVNSWPTWYRAVTPLVGFVCGAAMFFNASDALGSGSGFYRRRAIRSALGLLACLCMAWPLVPLAWLIMSAPGWARQESEWDGLRRWEARRDVRRRRRDPALASDGWYGGDW